MTIQNYEALEKSRAVLTIQVDAEAFDAAVERAYRKMRARIRVPGFRPGKAPRKIIEKMYGPEVFYDEAINASYPAAYDQAVKEKELRPIALPDVEITEGPTKDGYTFQATFPVYPKVELGQYKGLSAPKASVEVTEKDVEERLGQLADRNTRLVSVDREAAEGDTVSIDFQGFLDGEPFAGGKGENYQLELGSHSFVPGFEEQLVGSRAGDEKELHITFPDDYAAELAGKAVVFQVTVHEVKEKDVPPMDDEFAKDVSEFDTLAELRADLEEKIRKGRERDARRAFEDALMDQVADGITVDLPDVLVDGQARQFVENLKNSVYQQGITYDQYLKMTGMDEAKLLSDARGPAVKQVRMDLAVQAIIEAEGLEATDEDVEAEYARMAEEAGMDAESIKKYVSEERAREQVLTDKAIWLVAESATATELPKAEETAPASEDAPAASEGDAEAPSGD